MFRKSFFLLGLGSLVAGAWLYYRRQLELLENIKYKVVGVNIQSFAPLTLDISTELTNESEITFTLMGYEIDIFVNGEKVANVKNSNLNEKLKGFGDKSVINFTTTFRGKNEGGLKGILSGVLDNIADTDLQIKGKISVKRGFFEYTNYPVDFSYKLAEFL